MNSYITLTNAAETPPANIMYIIPKVESVNHDTINKVLMFDFMRLSVDDKEKLLTWQSKKLNVVQLVDGTFAFSSPGSIPIVPLGIVLHNGETFDGYLTDVKITYKNLRNNPRGGMYELFDGSITIQYSEYYG